MNSIIAVNWQATEPHWTADSSPFDRKFSLILVYDASGLVAFSVYRKLLIAGRPAIYRSGTEVLPAHQGRGLYGFFTTEVLKSSGADTRAASSTDGARAILSCGRQTPGSARKLRPRCSAAPRTRHCRLPASRCAHCSIRARALKCPGMIMRGAYGHIKHHRQAYHGAAALVDAAMQRIIPDSADALFSVGLVRV